MSNIYIKEPPTNGKVLLHTSMGDVDVELWSKEAPLACRNFVQLCMEGYYNGLIFHRIVANFIVQGGDPLGTGEGGESIYGKPFKDEFHSRLRFVRRGLVAMANSGPNDNGSQFFFTLASCMDLNKKHTIFGKVTGDTVYNLVRLGEVETDDNERPINPPYIKWTKVLANPFDDVIPRVTADVEKKEEKKKKKSQMKATKDFKLLSFGEEAEEEEIDTKNFDAVHSTGSKSSHDLAKDPNLSSTPALVEESRKREASPDSDSEDKKRLKIVQEKLQSNAPKKRPEPERADDASQSNEALRKESRKLAREILEARKPKQVESDHDDVSSDEDGAEAKNPELAEYKRQQRVYREKAAATKNKSSTREVDTLALLQRFNDKLNSSRAETAIDVSDDGDDDDKGWLLHRQFKNDPGFHDAKDVNRDVNEDRYDLSDPRNPLNKRRREKNAKEKRSRRR